jgi:protein TonB
MRISISFIGAILVTLMLFYIMIGFVQINDLPSLDITAPILVNIQKENKGNDQKDRQVSKIKKLSEEPTLTPKSNLVADLKPNPATIDIRLNLEMSPVQFEISALPKLQKNWVQPASLDTSNSIKGLDNEMSGAPKSISKITPVSTRMPIIPEVAWVNKINGWVLLAFTVTSEGRVKDIRVLNASPKGIFEENAVITASDWRYQGFIGYDRYVSQKIEFEWKNYPYNLDY